MLRLDRSIRDAIVEHAHRDHPDEACGIVAGPAGSDTAARFIPMLNAERSMTGYRFEGDEWRRVWLELDDRDEEPVVIYHSHTATEAYPSRTDVNRAREYATMLPDPHYVLVSTRDPEATEPDAVEFRSFRIVDGVITEEPVEVVDGPVADNDDPVQSYKFGHTPTSVVYDCSAES
ncbi:Mov34/MPN/PAD-1 family protein [Actinocatenispora rupis]|uniref:Peptidase n=1 Tax=Actinocatenispora rupis TaxID=519421 RepID=A0A8J3NA74_9ACTN|nr:M67 family metallopeptidase [Actinocatenispora rupis]GID11811.1 peptidase [Actinocatenispora rupis]